MRDINYPLRKAYYAALQATGLPVYYQSLPNNINPENYIVFRSINSNDASTKNSSDTSTTITVEIHTLKDIMNPGIDADNIAGDVYTYIYAISNFVLPMDEMQMVSTELSNDTVQNFQLNNQQAYISRFITFRHNVFISSNSGGGTIISQVGYIDRYQYAATGAEGDTIVIPELANKKMLMISKDGVVLSFIKTSGNATGKEVIYQLLTGTLIFAQELQFGENIFIVYQNL